MVQFGLIIEQILRRIGRYEMAIKKYLRSGELIAHIKDSYNSFDRYYTKVYDGSAIGGILKLNGTYLSGFLVAYTKDNATMHCEDVSWSSGSATFQGRGPFTINNKDYYLSYGNGLHISIDRPPDVYDIDSTGMDDRTIIITALSMASLDDGNNVKIPVKYHSLETSFDITVF